MNSAPVHERLRKLLFLVPYAAKHPGITVDELARDLGMPREQVLEDLDLLTMVGRPPFQPDDYIDIYVENGRVYVDLDQRLSRPPRLTAAEAVALSAAAQLLEASPGPVSGADALASARAKLERVLPPEARGRFREMGKKIDAAQDAPSELAPLARAVAECREVEFDYFSPERQATERRCVRPQELFIHRGQWYLSAWCLTRKDARLFRLDRIRRLEVTARAFTDDRRGSGHVPNPVGSRGEVRVRFTPEMAPWIRERFGQDARPLPDGGVEVKVTGASERWLTQWVLSFGGEAAIVEPEWAREAVARAARAALTS